MSGGAAVAVEGVDLTYDVGATALTEVDLRIPAGAICGVLGRNGSGKSSLMGLLAGYRRPTAGRVLVDGRDPFEDPTAAAAAAFVGEGGTGSTADTVRDALARAAAVRVGWDDALAQRLVVRFGIPPKTSISKLSRGGRAALAVTFGLAARAPLTMFDEPHLGMDVPTRQAFYDELLAACIDEPRTVLLATHHIDEVASLLSDVVILDRGRVAVASDVDELRERGVEAIGPTDAVERFAAGRTVLNRRSLGRTTSIATFGPVGDEAATAAAADGVELAQVGIQDLVVHLTDADRPADQEVAR